MVTPILLKNAVTGLETMVNILTFDSKSTLH